MHSTRRRLDRIPGTGLAVAAAHVVAQDTAGIRGPNEKAPAGRVSAVCTRSHRPLRLGVLPQCMRLLVWIGGARRSRPALVANRVLGTNGCSRLWRGTDVPGSVRGL